MLLVVLEFVTSAFVSSASQSRRQRNFAQVSGKTHCNFTSALVQSDVKFVGVTRISLSKFCFLSRKKEIAVPSFVNETAVLRILLFVFVPVVRDNDF